MEWSNENMRAALMPRWPEEPNQSFNLLRNFNYGLYTGNSSAMTDTQTGPVFPVPEPEKIINEYRFSNSDNNDMMLAKKKRLTSGQLASLERSFQEEIKLDSDRKMKLSRDLGLQPRQVAVWFQNRRARWKAKQLEHLYDSLRRQYDAVSQEKQRLQDEVKKLRALLTDRAMNQKQVSTGSTEFSGGDETAEITSATAPRSENLNNDLARGNFLYGIDQYNNPVGINNSVVLAGAPCWPSLLQPSYQ